MHILPNLHIFLNIVLIGAILSEGKFIRYFQSTGKQSDFLSKSINSHQKVFRSTVFIRLSTDFYFQNNQDFFSKPSSYYYKLPLIYFHQYRYSTKEHYISITHMTSLSFDKRPFSSSGNPFLKARNPFTVTDNLYSHSSSEQKYSSNGFFNENMYRSNCNHCIKNTPVLQQFQMRSKLLKNQKQNLQKVSAVRFKNSRTQQNPFQKKNLLKSDYKSRQAEYCQYSHNDQNNLKRLIHNNPFKKYAQQKYHPQTQNTQTEIKFHQIDFLTHSIPISRQVTKFQTNSRTDHIQNKQSARFSIQSLNNNINRMDSYQNSPGKKSRFSPTMMDIATYRVSSLSSKKNIIEGIHPDKGFSLITQINRSRKDLLAQAQYQKKESCKNIAFNDRNKMPPRSPQKQTAQDKQKTPQFIMIRGNKFFLQKVQMRY